MEYEKIKQLMEDMKNYKISSVDLELADGTKISMKKQEENLVNKSTEGLVDRELLEKTILEKISLGETNNNISSDEENNDSLKKVIKSPMVGTFYSKPSPITNPYVETGKDVKKGTVVCIIEAMKLMNEIESEYDGRIAKILVEDGQMVEYGTPLFVVE